MARKPAASSKPTKAAGMKLGPSDPFDQGVAAAAPDSGTAKGINRVAEEALVGRWFERIDRAREHDRAAYAQLAKDRAYARGDSIFETKVNVIGSYIDTWTSLLYARDPDLDIMPSPAAGPRRIEDARHFAKAAEIVISAMWRQGRLKANARPWVRAALTSQVGWLKATWQERMGNDPTTDMAIADLQDNLERIAALTRKMKDEGLDNAKETADAEEIRQAIESLSEGTERKTTRQMVFDPVDMADITVSDECPSINRYLDSPWISHRTYMRLSTARGSFPDLDEDCWKKATIYSQKKPEMERGQAAALADWNAIDADAYTAMQGVGGDGFVCIEEVWDRDTDKVVTLVRGVKRYAARPYAPEPGTTRFYPFFALTFTEVDGQRWAQSLNQRSQSLQDAFSRCVSAFEEHRKRIKPKVIFNAGALEEGEVRKLEAGVTNEMVAIRPANIKQDVRQMFSPMVYAQLDPMVYDVGPILSNFELVWGLQEAMTATVDVAKTATEAEIQQSGTQSRTGDKRDRLEQELQDLGSYCLEIAVQKLTMDEARTLCGPEVLWLEGLAIDDIPQLVNVDLRAGSSGKPNTRAQREAWAATMPLIQALIMQIGAMRQSSPLEMANKLEELIVETADRSGESIDPARFIPQIGQPVTLLDPVTGQPVQAYPGGPAAPGAAPGMPAAAPQPGGPGDAPADIGAPPPDTGFPQ